MKLFSMHKRISKKWTRTSNGNFASKVNWRHRYII